MGWAVRPFHTSPINEESVNEESVNEESVNEESSLQQNDVHSEHTTPPAREERFPQKKYTYRDAPTPQQVQDGSERPTYTSVRAFKKRLEKYKKRRDGHSETCNLHSPMYTPGGTSEYLTTPMYSPTTPMYSPGWNSEYAATPTTTVSDHEDVPQDNCDHIANNDAPETVFLLDSEPAPCISGDVAAPVTKDAKNYSSQESSDGCVYHEHLNYATWGSAQFTDVSDKVSASVAMMVAKRLREHGIRKDVPASMKDE